MEQQIWMITSGVCTTPGAEGVPTYGVRVTYPGGAWAWADVDTDIAVVQVLADRLNRLQPEPCHFADMVLDFIEEYAVAGL